MNLPNILTNITLKALVDGCYYGIVKKLDKNIETMSNEELRICMIRISIESYHLSVDREQTSLKEACAIALYKEGMANSYGAAAGSVEARKNQSIIDTMDKQAVSILYTTVSSLFKAKVDEAHRLASVIGNILISRSAEAKLYYSPRSTGDDMNSGEDFLTSNSIENE